LVSIEDPDERIFEMLQESKLARHVRDLYTNLTTENESRLWVNDWINCTVSILPPIKV
jgi:hypothetical protein